MINAGIVGLGWWGQVMVEEVRKTGKHLTFTHAAVRDTGRAEEFAASNGIKLHDSLDALLQEPSVDAIVLATPHSVHVEQIIACAKAGKPVFSEKPLALTLSEGKRAVEACEQNSTLLGLGTDRRFLPAMQRLKSMLEEGVLGDILHVEAQYSNNNMTQGLSGDWRTSTEEAPAAGMTGPGLHALDALINLVGPVKDLSGNISRPYGEKTQIDTVSLLLWFQSSVTGILGCVRGVPNYFRIAVYGTGGWVELRGFGTLHLYLKTQSEQGEVVETFNSELAIAETLDLFASAVEEREPFPVSTASMLQTVAAFETAVNSFVVEGPLNVPIIDSAN